MQLFFFGSFAGRNFSFKRHGGKFFQKLFGDGFFYQTSFVVEGIGIFYERKDALLLYLEEQQKVQTNELLEKLIESFRMTVELYRRLMFEILGGGTEGWNSLFEPVDKTCYPEIVNVLEELKASEERNVELAKRVADGI